jgi:hypothetical protein
MKINPYLLVLQVFAVCASYLILSTTFVGALQINVVTGTSQQVQGDMSTLDDLITKNFQFTYDYASNMNLVTASFEPKDPSVMIKKAYLYICRDYNPVQCVQNQRVLPHIFVGTSDIEEEFMWSEVNVGGVGNFLALLKLDVAGKTVWVGSWDQLTRTGSGAGSEGFSHESYDLNSMNLYLNPGVSADPVKSYAEGYSRVPMNYVNKTVLTTVGSSAVSSIYELLANDEDLDPSGTTNPVFSTNIATGNAFEKTAKKWAFIFGSAAKMSNPVAFYSPGGDLAGAGGARLVIDKWTPSIVTCESDDAISIDAHIDNASQIKCGQPECYYKSFYYEVDGVRPHESTMTCSVSGYKYNCTIPVSNFPVCAAPKTSTITAHFTYADGSDVFASFPVDLRKTPAKLVVDSLSPNPFDCGTDTKMMVLLRVTNPPSGDLKKEYTLDGTTYKSLSCAAPYGNVYSCSITDTDVCSLLKENLEAKFRFTYAGSPVETGAVSLFVTFPPPSMGIDSLTPEIFTTGQTLASEILIHINYPDTLTYNLGDFKFKYLDSGFQSTTCTLHQTFPNRKYYKCPVTLTIPSGLQGSYNIRFKLDGFKDGAQTTIQAEKSYRVRSPPPGPSLTVTYASGLDCAKDPSLTVRARADNTAEVPTKYEYSTDGTAYTALACTESSGSYTCTIPKDSLCSSQQESMTLGLKFTYPAGALTSNFQTVSLSLPVPSMRVYSIFPDPVSRGESNQGKANLYILYPSYVSTTPMFVYSYSFGVGFEKINERMSCTRTKQASTSDFYECTVQFDVPEGYSATTFIATFGIQGTDLMSTYNVNVADQAIATARINNIAASISVEPGNSTTADLFVETQNVEESASLSVLPRSWISGGACQKQTTNSYKCPVTITVPSSEPSNPAKELELTLRIAGAKSKDMAGTFTINILPVERKIEIQQKSPGTLYCPDNTQKNPAMVTITARLVNFPQEGVALTDEEIKFKGVKISPGVKRCTLGGQSITCTIPVDKFIEQAACGEADTDLAPGEGSVSYPFILRFGITAGSDSFVVSGADMINIEAPPLRPYITLSCNGNLEPTASGRCSLKRDINCLGSTNIEVGKLLDEFVRIDNADLLHDEPLDDLTWSFVLDAQDSRGKLTKGRGSTPSENATVCRLKSHVMVDAHRQEDYECNLYVENTLFQRCEGDMYNPGYGTLEIVASSAGKQANGKIAVHIRKGIEEFDIKLSASSPQTALDCIINDYSGYCTLTPSRLNTTMTIRNYGNGSISDLTVYQQDVSWVGSSSGGGTGGLIATGAATGVQGDYVDATMSCPRTLTGTLLKCNIDVGPRVKMAEAIDPQKPNPGQTFTPIKLGQLNATVFYKYANNLVFDSKSTTLGGGITANPKKTQALIDTEKARESIQKMVDRIEKITKKILFVAGFCLTCYAGVKLYDWADKPDKPAAGTVTGNNQASTVTTSPEGNPSISEEEFQRRDQAARSRPSGGAAVVAIPISGAQIGLNVNNPAELQRIRNDLRAQGLAPASSQTGAQTTLDNAASQVKKGGISTIVAIVLVVLLLFTLTFVIVKATSDDVNKKNSEFTEDIIKGVLLGTSCLIMKLLADMIPSGKVGTPVSKGLDIVAGALGKACEVIGKLTPLLFKVYQLLIQWMLMQNCMQDIQRRTGYYSSYGESGWMGETTSGVYGTASAIDQVSRCMSYMNTMGQQVDDIFSYGGSALSTSFGSPDVYLVKPDGTKIDPTIPYDMGTNTRMDTIKVKYNNLCKMMNKYSNVGIMYVRVDGVVCDDLRLITDTECTGYSSSYQPWGSGYQQSRTSPGTAERPFGITGCNPTVHQNKGHHEVVVSHSSGYSATITYEKTKDN